MEVMPPVPYQQFLSDQITKMEDAALRGTQTPSQALSSLKGAIDVEVRRRKELGYDR